MWSVFGFKEGLKAHLHLQFSLRFSSFDRCERVDYEYSEYMFLYLNICVWFIRSHPSKGENRTRNRAKVASVNQPLDSGNHSLLLKKLDHYGIRGIAKKLFISYLNDRRQEFCSWTLVIPIIHP